MERGRRGDDEEEEWREEGEGMIKKKNGEGMIRKKKGKRKERG